MIPRTLVPRSMLLILGTASIAWGIFVLPSFWQQSRLDKVAYRILLGQEFKEEDLNGLLPVVRAVQADENCRPSALRSSAIILLRVVELGVSSGERGTLDANFQHLRRAIRRSLECAPADPFLWLILYWAEVSTNGFRPESVKYLEQSYRLGQSEGWIAIKRNGLALAVVEELPPELSDRVLREFSAMVSTGFITQAVDNFLGPGWTVKDKLLLALSNADPISKIEFAKRLRKKGFEIQVPGVQLPPLRPWDN